MSSLRSAPIFSLSLAALLAACGSNSTSSDAGPDGGDAGPHNDGGNDAGQDAGLPGDGGAPPGAPILSFTTSASGVQLTWTLPGAFGGELFAVYRSDQGGPFTAVAGATGVSADDYSDGIASAQPGAGHAYYVTARNGNGTGPASNTVDVQQAPGDLAAGGSDTRVLLVWSAVGNATSYDVYRTTGDAGTATLLGNSTQAEYIDNGSVAPVTTGTTYQYQLIAHAIDGGQPSTGSNIVTARALGIDLSVNVTHVSDVVDGGVTVADTVSPANAGPLAITDAGTAHEILAFSTSTASVMPGVPTGPYEIGLPIPGTSPGNYIYLATTSARSIDLGSVVPGRVDAAYPSDLTHETTITYALTGLDSWTEVDGGLVDTLQSVSIGAGNFVTGLEDDLTDAGITSGATTFAGVEDLAGFYGDEFLVNSTEGDIYYLSQLHVTQSGQGAPYLSLVKSTSNSSLNMTDGSNTALAAALAAPALVNIPDVVVKNSAFAAQKTSINPAATNAGQTVDIYAQKDFATYGEYGNPTTLAEVTLDGSAVGDVDLGSMVYGNPFPASWQPYLEVAYSYNVPFDLTGEASGGTATFESTSVFHQPLTGINWTSAIAPPLAPVTNVKINGTLSAFADQTKVSLTPTFSWTAPSGAVAPNNYIVSVYELALDDSGNVAIGNSSTPVPPQDYSFITSATSFTIPAGVFTAETSTAAHWYFASVDAVYTASGSTPIDLTASPYRSGTTSLDVQVVTNKFTPGAGTAPPSTYRRPPVRAVSSGAHHRRLLAPLAR